MQINWIFYLFILFFLSRKWFILKKHIVNRHIGYLGHFGVKNTGKVPWGKPTSPKIEHLPTKRHTDKSRTLNGHTQTYRHTDRQTDLQTHRQTDRETDTQTDKQTHRQTHRHTDRHTDTRRCKGEGELYPHETNNLSSQSIKSFWTNDLDVQSF